MKHQRLLLAALAAALPATAAWADPPWAHEGRHEPPGWAHGHHKPKHHHKHRDDEPEVVYVQPAPPPPPRAVVVYPPWIVQQQGQVVYEPQYRPMAPSMPVSRCNSQAAGQVLGGIVGGVLGHQIGEGNGKTLATVGGAVAGVLVGGEIGRSLDAGSQGCVGQVLEVAPVGRRVQWQERGVTYAVMPQKVMLRHGDHCRPYTLQVRTRHGWRSTQGVACRRPGGVWVAS
jgi:outer membrane lipoprotein SlyB